MNQSEVESYCKSFLKDNYNLELTIPVKINSRLKTTLGFFAHKKNFKEPLRLEFSKKYLEFADRSEIIKLIVHECVHFALYMLDKPYIDGDEYFEAELVKHGAPSTDVITFKIERNVRVYACECAEHVFLQTIRPSRCNGCKTNLAYVGRRKELV